MAPIEEKLTNIGSDGLDMSNGGRLEALVRSGVLKRVDNVKKGRRRLKLTWDESVKR